MTSQLQMSNSLNEFYGFYASESVECGVAF
jgi:hypothetical protein